MYIIFLLVSIFASLIGAICGVGGGIIIKPSLDALGILDVASISFLSGCTVLSMTLYSVVSSKIKKESRINFKVCTALAVGAVIGGVIGKTLFQMIWDQALNKDSVGFIQAVCLIVITVATLIYTLFRKRIKTHDFDNPFITIVIGVVLGIMSSFLGIGGGPVNLIVLFYFFSMDIKEAAENSLYIILFSQMASLVSAIVTQTIPNVDLVVLGLMVVGGVLGGILGRGVNKKIQPHTVGKLFIGLMAVVIVINIYNAFSFAG